jgi:hypothetical protein
MAPSPVSRTIVCYLSKTRMAGTRPAATTEKYRVFTGPICHILGGYGLIHRKTVQQPRGRGVPWMRRIVVAQILQVVVAEHDRALRAARVDLAGHVFVGRNAAANRSGCHGGWAFRRAYDDLALLRQVVFLAQFVVGAVQIGNARGDDDAFRIRPRPFANAVARVHRARSLRRQISMPGLGARAGDPDNVCRLGRDRRDRRPCPVPGW